MTLAAHSEPAANGSALSLARAAQGDCSMPPPFSMVSRAAARWGSIA